jgi:hypothetical protein
LAASWAEVSAGVKAAITKLPMLREFSWAWFRSLLIEGLFCILVLVVTEELLKDVPFKLPA